jgi:nucleoside-diphosphate-sugar epimerase
MNILITGNRGFVGRYFQQHYEAQGHQVLGVDIVDSLDVRKFFAFANHTQFDLVIHLAAVVGGRAKIEGSPLSVAVDLSIDAEMWQWAIRTKQKRVVYFSSSAAYPVSLQRKDSHRKLKESDIDLSNIQNPDLTYGWSKLTGEYLAQFAKAEGVKVHIFRPFSGYGEDQALDYPFPSFIKRGLDRDNPFVIWGDGTQTRDFVHISDVVGCVEAAISMEYDQPLNIGTGHPTSFMELAEMVSKHAGYFPKYQLLKDKPEGVNWRVADISAMSAVYKPKVDLDEGISRALKFMKKNS